MNMICEEIIDLHTHTTASDGSMSPAELVRHAKQKGLKAIAVTDHDTVNGLREAVEEGNKLGIEVIPGIEISVDFSPEMHLLGYFMNGDYQAISDVLSGLKRNREERNPRIIRKLNEMGFDITMDEVSRLASGDIIGRPHIAKVMFEKGYVGSIEEAFEKYLAAGRPAYFKKDKLLPEEGIFEIGKAGGIPVLAHPIYLKMDRRQLDMLLAGLVQAGLKGMEAYYSENTPEQTQELLLLAERHRLFITGGSDFHGAFKPYLEIGTGRGDLRVPYKLLTRMKNAN